MTMMITTMVHLLPMFHAVDSTMRAHIENNGPAIKSVLSDERPQPAAEEMHHGVHKNVIEHRQVLREHLEKEIAKRMQQKIAARNQPQNRDVEADHKKLEIQSSKQKENQVGRKDKRNLKPY